jgi:molybdopterin molybdotransferase
MGSQGFTEVTRLAAAREALLAAVDPPDATESVAVADAAGRTIAEGVAATRDVPGFDRAAMDGYALRAADTHGASERSPVRLDLAGGAAGQDEEVTVGPRQARYVHTGSPLPDGADAVVKVERTEKRGDAVEVSLSVPPGNDVAPAGEDVEKGAHLFDAGRRLRVSDLGLLKAAGHWTIGVAPRPTVSVIPTGEELVEFDPGYGETTETNGLTVSRLAERWGGEATYRDIVGDDADALADAIAGDTDHDIVVTTGGSSVGERDLLPGVVGDLGEVLVHGVALKPGHPVGFGVVDGTPVLTLPGYPVSCLVTAFQLLRPAIADAGGFELEEFPAFEATLDAKIAGEVGTRSFVRVRRTDDVEDGEADSLPTAEPVRGGAGVLSSVAAADGWVVVPENLEGVAAGEPVTVQRWEAFH